MGFYQEDEPSFFQKNRVPIVGGVIVVIGIAVWFGKGRFETARSRQDQRMVMIDLPPPAPLPPPPTPQSQKTPPPPMENEQKMIEQEPVNAMESKPDETPVNDSPVLGTSIQGDGPPDGFGLRGGNSFGGGTGKAASRGQASRWGWYAIQVQSSISQALQNNTQTRTSDFRSVVQIWSDKNGRIKRARLSGTTGNIALDNAITNEILAGLVLQEPPPDGMPMPIVLRLTARHSQMALSR